MIRTNKRTLATGFSTWLLVALCIMLVACKDSTSVGDGPVTPMKEYTLDNAREWTPIAKFHAPQARRSYNNGSDAISIEVPLDKADEGHYIEKIGLMDMAGREIAVKTLKRERNPITVAYFDVKLFPWEGRVKVFAKCNKHDLWVTEINVKSLGI